VSGRAREAALDRVGAFLADLRAGRAEPEHVQGVLRDVLAAPGLELLLVVPDGPPPEPAPAWQAVHRVRQGEATLAELRYDPDGLPHPELVEPVAEAATFAIEIARLRSGLRRGLEEVTASRARIVEAGDAERRRIERNLHDGAQQRLITVGLALRHAQHLLAPGDREADIALDGAMAELSGATRALRELAGGMVPAGLQDGLAGAFDELAARTPIPVDVAVPADRFPAELEVAAYFVAAEGVANAVKHAGASRVRVTAAREDGSLVVAVRDDGSGGADAGRGSGLRGLADRVAAHGGSLDVVSPLGSGTTVTAVLPCG
jgi:signal transduction histidine kinase